MPIKFFKDVPGIAVAKINTTFAAAGMDSTNTRIVYEVGNPLKSWVPGRAINSISGFEAGKGYYVVPSADLNLFPIVSPPLFPPTYTKGTQTLSNPGGTADYAAFGFKVRTGPDRMTFITRIGGGHLVGATISNSGGVFYRHWSISTQQPLGPWTLLETHARNLEDVAGGLIDGNKIIVFYTVSDNGFYGHTVNTEEIYYKIYDLNLTYVGPTVDVMANLPVVLSRGWAFGKTQRHNIPGQSSIDFVQVNTDPPDGPGDGRCRVGILKSTTNWSAPPYFAYKGAIDAAAGVNENVSAYLGYNGVNEGKMVKFVRRLGSLLIYTSTDYGENWTALGPSNLGYYNYKVKIPSVCMHKGKLDIIFADRDSLFIEVSRNNDPTVFFGTTTFNEPMLVRKADSPASLYPILGYPDQEVIDEEEDGNEVFLQSWSYENVGSGSGDLDGVTTIQYTVNNWKSTGPPAQPTTWGPVVVDTTGTPGPNFRIEITGLTPTQLETVQRIRCDLSKNSDYSTFVDARINAGEPAVSIHNRPIRLFAYFYLLEAATTYYYRVWTENELGVSEYLEGSYTTP